MTQLADTTLLSLTIATTACVLAGVVAVTLAYVAGRSRRSWLWVVESLLLLPLVMPPTLVGYALVMLLGRHGWAGSLMFRATGETLLFRTEAAILAASVVAFPLIYLPARTAFKEVDPHLIDEARLNGGTGWSVFWRVSLPMSSRVIAAGLTLAFARALGEFGATVMVFGIQPTRLTLPIALFRAYDSGQPESAWPVVVVLVLISIALMAAYRLWSR